MVAILPCPLYDVIGMALMRTHVESVTITCGVSLYRNQSDCLLGQALVRTLIMELSVAQIAYKNSGVLSVMVYVTYVMDSRGHKTAMVSIYACCSNYLSTEGMQMNIGDYYHDIVFIGKMDFKCRLFEVPWLFHPRDSNWSWGYLSIHPRWGLAFISCSRGGASTLLYSGGGC